MKLQGRHTLSGEEIQIEFDSTIIAVDPVLGSVGSSSTFVSAGFIDLQVNGFADVDFNSATTTEDEIGQALNAMFATGVTRCLPTIITNEPGAMLERLQTLASARESLPHGKAIEAFHVEGPHISPDDAPRGAHPKQWVRPPDIEEYKRWQAAAQGLVRIVTLAPEWPGATEYIEQVTREGVVVSIGHTRASAEQIHDAVRAGATMSTHLGNGAGSRDRRDEFIAQQLRESALTASFIADRHHLPDEFLRRAIESKGVERSVLVTDAVAPAMCEPGPYTLGDVLVELRPDGRVTLRGAERLAGSGLRMDRAITNVMTQAGVSFAEAIVMATTNAARAGRLAGRLRGLQPGERGDLILFRLKDGEIEVLETFVSGERVFSTA